MEAIGKNQFCFWTGFGVGRKRGMGSDSKAYGLRNWKDEVPFPEMRQDLQGSVSQQGKSVIPLDTRWRW